MWCVPVKLQALADKNRSKQGHVGCGLFPQPTANTCCPQCVLGNSEEVNPLQPQARLFRLVRHANPTAILAEGVEWSDGAATLRRRGPWPSTTTWDAGVEALLATQAPDARTQLHWTQDPLPSPPDDPIPPADPTPTIWLPPPTPEGLCSRCGQLWPCLSCGP